MKKLVIISAIILCLTFVLGSCGNEGVVPESTTKAEVTEKQGKTEDTESKTQQSEEAKTDNSYQVMMLMGSEVTQGTFTYKFTVKDSSGAAVTDASVIKADVEIKNKNDVVVYTGSPKVTISNGACSIEVLTSEMKKSNHNVGTATVTVTAGSTTKTGTSSMYKLPYDFADITLPEVKSGYLNMSSSGDMRTTYDITEVSIGDESTVSYYKENLNFKIKLSGKITARGEAYSTAKTPGIDIIGYAADGTTVLFTQIVSCTAGENDTFTGVTTVREYVPGTVVKFVIKQ